MDIPKFLFVAVFIGLQALAAEAALPTAPQKKTLGAGWSKKGTDFWLHCFDSDPEPAPCKQLRLVSPDGKSAVEIFYRRPRKIWDPEFPKDRYAYLRVLRPGLPPRVLFADGISPDNSGGPTAELVWAPNSRAFLINGHVGSASDYFVRVFSLADPALRPIDPTAAASQELAANLKSWCVKPAPKPFNIDCLPLLKPGYFNMWGVDWLPDSSGIAVFAEVYPSSGSGLIMGQSRGYEIGVLGHHFLHPMTTAEFKAHWQGSAAWNITTPPSQADFMKMLDDSDRK